MPADAKPPLGVLKRSVHEYRRVAELLRAIRDYAAAGLPINVEWADELTDLFERLIPGGEDLRCR